jgi:GntR family transcriptional regulator
VFVRERLRSAIDDARRSELDPGEIEAILREEWAKGNGAVAKPSGQGG